jgi:divalent metal cation (Fe/Co/Zn/Cd) transporter
VRRAGIAYRVTIHVQADPKLPLEEAHILSGQVKSAIRAAMPAVRYVLVHMEPFVGTANREQPVLA